MERGQEKLTTRPHGSKYFTPIQFILTTALILQTKKLKHRAEK